MSQLYAQLASRPSPWLLGRTSAGLCTLQTACPLTITYSGGSPAADTIAAGSAATVYAGRAATFDASADVWVVLTVPGSGALQVVTEADLATVTGDWAGLARVVQHSTEPYQPQAYLASGGLGNQGGTTTTFSQDATAKALTLWNGSSNNSPPASWYTAGFDDSAWGTAIDAGFSNIWPETALAPLSNTEQALFRQWGSLPAGTITAASLTFLADDDQDGIWINGTAIAGTTVTDMLHGSGARTVSVPPALLLPGQRNLIAAWAANRFPSGAGDAFTLSVTYAGTGQTVATSGVPAAGDLLYYHNGAWIDLPAGTSGTVLTSDGTDPGWAAPATSGTVTSVQVAVPAPLSASGGPITASGTMTLAWASGQTANRVLASPNGSSGAVSLRALVGDDMPVDASTIISSAGTIKGNYQAGSGVSISGNTISATGSGGSVTSVALTVPGIFSVSGSPVTTSGTLAVSLATQSAHTVFAGPASGSAAAPTFRALQSSDLPAAAGAGGKIHAHGHFI